MNFETLLLNVTNAIHFDIISLVASLENYTLAVSAESFTYIQRAFSFVSENWCPIYFTELQKTLLAVFVAIIVINLSLIAFFWNKYGGVITDRFIRPSTQKEIEELKLSVAKLKLPCEHTPRI